MSDFEKLFEAQRMILKVQSDYINEYSDFVRCFNASNPEDLNRARYLQGRADAICTAYSIISNLINQE